MDDLFLKLLSLTISSFFIGGLVMLIADNPEHKIGFGLFKFGGVLSMAIVIAGGLWVVWF